MKPNLPNWLFILGVLALGLSNTTKELAPDTLGRITALHWGCAIVSGISFSVGLLLSLRGLFVESARPWRFLMPLFCNLVFLVMFLGLYFMALVVMSKIYQFGSDSLFPDMLPKLIDESQSTDSTQKRVKVAKVAYEFYGVRLIYRDETGNFIAFTPSADDDSYFAREKKIRAQNQAVLVQLKGALDQYPYLFSFCLGAFLLTFLIGPLCFAFRRKRPVSIEQAI
jgi:hypothetical protein